MDSFAALVGSNTLGSWDAVVPGTNPPVAHDVIAPKAGCSFARPNGSGEGVGALRKSLNAASTATPPAPVPGPGCVDIARSSSKAATTDQNPAGLLVYIPFALDAVAVTTGGTTNIANADGFSVALLQSLYQCTPVLVGGVTYDPNTPSATGNQHVNIYLPQTGSGTRNFWADTMGIPRTGNACTHDTIVAGPSAGLSVQEHDGTVYASDPDGIGPFSVAQWVAQSNGINDRRHGAVLHSLATTAAPTTPIPPTTGTPAALNPAYPISREVYNVVPFSSVSGASADPTLVTMLVGTSSFMCTHPGTTLHFGFGLLNSSPLGHTCGAVANDLRAFLVL
jgi:phosphate transport system substrate-binding protein